MRYAILNTSYLNPATNTIESKPVKLDALDPADPLPPNHKAVYLPRIRCMDCPGKLYNAGPGQTTANFELHLKNRVHVGNVVGRLGRAVS